MEALVIGHKSDAVPSKLCCCALAIYTWETTV